MLTSTQTAVISQNGPYFRIGMVDGRVEAGLHRDVSEGSVTVVVIQGAVVQTGDEEVGMPVVVVIADSDTHVVTRACETGGIGDVGEHSVAIITEKTVSIFGIVFL